MSDATQTTTTWPDLAIGFYDELTGRGAEIYADILSENSQADFASSL